MFGDVDDRVCWVVISDVGLWYVDGNCYMWRLSLVGVLLVLRFLFGSVCSNDGSNQRGAMFDVLSSNFSISSDSLRRCDSHHFSKCCICWITSSCLSIRFSSLSRRSQMILIDLVSCAI